MKITHPLVHSEGLLFPHIATDLLHSSFGGDCVFCGFHAVAPIVGYQTITIPGYSGNKFGFALFTTTFKGVGQAGYSISSGCALG